MRSTEGLVLVLVLVLHFCLLLALAPPGVVPGDGAEVTYGIQGPGLIHPPGYPLYVVLGHFLYRIGPLPASLAASAFSALFAVLSLSVLYLFLRRRNLSTASSALSLLVLAVAYPIWDVSVKPEVYTLGLFLLISTVYCWDCVLRDRSSRLVLWLVAGLSLTHHPLGVFNVLLAVHATWKTLPSFRIREGVAFVLPFSLYGGLFFFGAAGPFNWPLVATPGELFNHVLGGSFSRFFFAEGLMTPLVQLGRMTVAHLSVFPVFLVLFVAVGYRYIHRDLLPLVGLQLVLLGGMMAYGVPDVYDFLFPSYLVATIALANGIDGLRNMVPRIAWAVTIALVVSYGILFYLVGGGLRYDWHNYHYPAEYAASVNQELTRGTVLSDWSHYAVLRYYQQTQGYLSGVHLLSPTHRFNNWAAIVEFHRQRGQPVFTTIRNWNPPDRMTLQSRGPVFEVTARQDE